ncbi:hypothetical protein [Paenibacillus vietnamensis]|nr:hypothetical protein [Paenibacillus vietnamensis]
MEITRKEVIKAFVLALIATPLLLGLFYLACYIFVQLWEITQ